MQHGGRRTLRRVASILLLCGAAAGAQGNPLEPAVAAAIPVRGLSFGALLPGVPDIITVGDASRRAEFLLVGSGTVDVSFILPAALTSDRGGQIPLRFEARDAALFRGAAEGYVVVNPLGVTRVNLSSTSGPVRLVIGARATPSARMTVGTYAATIVVVLAKPGT